MNPLLALGARGQAVWLDFLARRFIADGSLERLVEEDGLAGITSNPSIFEKAIAGGADYDEALKQAESEGDRDAMALYERLAIEDIRNAADVLRPVYEASEGGDGYMSLEVSPYLANDTEATVAEARRLSRTVGRDNLMIKVPATPAGLPAIRRLTGEGININITLLFSRDVYGEVVEAYFSGLEELIARGGDPGKVASVASFFVSRIDVAVEKRIDELLAGGSGERALLEGLRGKVAIANAKLAYRDYRVRFSGPRWNKLAKAGARVQRLLWASTGRKNPAYRDTLYVEELIGRETINTMPPATMDAFRDHGVVRGSLDEDVPAAERVMATLARSGISIDEVTGALLDDAVRLFADAFDKLLGAVARKRTALLGDRLDSQRHALPGLFAAEVEACLEDWRKAGKLRHLWAGEANLWTGRDETQWLGWLGIVDEQCGRLAPLAALAKEVQQGGFSHILLIGMGGSSLGPEVLATSFGRQAGHPELLVLDSTDPAQIRTMEARLDPARTLFIVSSKSGGTLEPSILQSYFFERVAAVLGRKRAGSRFIAITDPGTKLEKTARRDGFRHVLHGKADIGGRYSVLSDFGMAPAAAMGLDPGRLLSSAQLMVRSCAPSVPPADNPGALLGTVMGVAGRLGRDKITLIVSPGIADLGAWLEQLIAESTGKDGKGLIPVADEPLGAPEAYGEDRLFVYLRLDAGADRGQDEGVAALEKAGQPVVHIGIADPYHLGQEFFRWEFATAVAGAILGVDPFDQPDVEASKVRTRELTAAYERDGELPSEAPFVRDDGLAFFADAANREALAAAGDTTAAQVLKAHLDRLEPGDYCALLAYVERNEANGDALRRIRVAIRDARRVATCVGFGPRFLHSTGQAYKGGPASGVFLQISCDAAPDIAVPGHAYSFGTVIAAEAAGDFEVLAARGRRLLRVHLGSDVQEGLAQLEEAVRQALA
jgi:transaldolase / glucose-6-phosphate isomerase